MEGIGISPNIPKSQGGHYVPASSMVWEVSNILPLGLPPASKEFAKPPFKISKRMEKVKEVM